MNQDVRDTVAELATSDIATTLALRAVSRSWRLAVDGRLRLVAAETQPDLRPWARETSATSALPPLCFDLRSVTEIVLLDESSDSERGNAAEALLLHFPGDPRRRTLRAGIVAFAFDGAKDPIHESGWCGRRVLRILGGHPAGARAVLGREGDRHDHNIAERAPALARVALMCLEEAFYDVCQSTLPVLQGLAQGPGWTPRRAQLSLTDEQSVNFARVHVAPFLRNAGFSISESAIDCGLIVRLAASLCAVRDVYIAIGTVWPRVAVGPLRAVFEGLGRSGAAIEKMHVVLPGVPARSLIEWIQPVCGTLTDLTVEDVEDFDQVLLEQTASTGPLKMGLRRLVGGPELWSELVASGFKGLEVGQVLDSEALKPTDDGELPGRLTAAFSSLRRLELFISSRQSEALRINLTRACPRLTSLSLHTGVVDDFQPVLPPTLRFLSLGNDSDSDRWLQRVHESTTEAVTLPTLRCLITSDRCAQSAIPLAASLKFLSVSVNPRANAEDRDAVRQLVRACCRTVRVLYVPDYTYIPDGISFDSLCSLKFENSVADDPGAIAFDAASLVSRSPKLSTIDACGATVDSASWELPSPWVCTTRLGNIRAFLPCSE